MSKTTTFPLSWDQVTSLESRLIVEFMEDPSRQTTFNLLQITLGCRFGLRVSDLLQLRWSQVISTPTGQDLVVVERKTGKYRSIRLSKKVRMILDTVLGSITVIPNHYIFSSQKGKGVKPITVQGFNRRLRLTLDRLKTRYKGNPSSHLLRKSCVVGMIRRGFEQGDHLSLVKVSRLINHSSINQTIKYTNFETSELSSLYEID